MKKTIFKDDRGEVLLMLTTLSLFLIMGLMTSVLLYMFNHHRQKLKEFESLKLFYYAEAGVEWAMLNIKNNPNYYRSNPLQQPILPGINYQVFIKVDSSPIYDPVWGILIDHYRIFSYAEKKKAKGEVLVAREIEAIVKREEETDAFGNVIDVNVYIKKWQEILPPINPKLFK